MAYFGENWDDNEFPLAYLITIRTYGTWLHGDERLSVDAHTNIYGTPKRSRSELLSEVMTSNMKQRPVILDRKEREVVHRSVEEVCRHRNFKLHALNVRSNHFHVVVSAQTNPESIANALKSYATRALREKRLVAADARPWARGRSRRYLWRDGHVEAAIQYVLYFQGDLDFGDWYEGKFDG